MVNLFDVDRVADPDLFFNVKAKVQPRLLTPYFFLPAPQMRVLRSRALLAFLLAGTVCVDARSLRKLAAQTPDERAQATLSQMTLEEKLSLVCGEYLHIPFA
jgi:hypothetical protein